MRAPFGYYGGKQRLASKIIRLFPPHLVYVEPFAGSGAVLFAKPIPPMTDSNSYREVLNDQNQAVLSVFRAMRQHPKAFGRAVELMPYSTAEYARARAIYRGEETEADPVERAALFMLLLGTSMGGKLSACAQKQSTRGENNAWIWDNKRALVHDWTQRLSRVYIQDLDALDCIRRWDSPQTLFYVDPPYVGTNQGHYGGWTSAHQAELLETLTAAQGAFILSGYDNEETRHFAEIGGWRHKAHRATCSAGVTSTKRDRVEHLWHRGRAEEPQATGSRLDLVQALSSRAIVETFPYGVEGGQGTLFSQTLA